MILSYSDRRLGAAEIFVHLAQSWNVSFGLLLNKPLVLEEKNL